MKKENFISLILGTIGGLFFALGMCMCLVAEWAAFSEGVIMGAIGLVILLAMLVVRRRMLGLAPLRLSGKALSVIMLSIS